MPEPTRKEMLTALLHREDLLSSREWPWTTDRLRSAYALLLAESDTTTLTASPNDQGAPSQ